MTTQKISRQHISGAMKKKDRPEWMIDPCTCALCGVEKKVTGSGLRPNSRTLSCRRDEI